MGEETASVHVTVQKSMPASTGVEDSSEPEGPVLVGKATTGDPVGQARMLVTL